MNGLAKPFASELWLGGSGSNPAVAAVFPRPDALKPAIFIDYDPPALEVYVVAHGTVAALGRQFVKKREKLWSPGQG